MQMGNRIKEERERLGLGPEEFSAGGGVSLRSQQMYENGKTVPSAEYCARIVELGVDVNYILTGKRTAEHEVVKPQPTDQAVISIKTRQIAELLASLDDEKQLEILAVIKESKRVRQLEDAVHELQATVRTMLPAKQVMLAAG